MDKPNVEVIAHFNLDGIIIPLRIKMTTETDEFVYHIDKVSMPVKGRSLKIGIQGERYICKIQGKTVYLYLDENNKWFLEF